MHFQWPSHHSQSWWNCQSVSQRLMKTYNIWDFCEINESPMDGHCLFHPIISSIKAQLNKERDIRIDHLLRWISCNVFANYKRYSHSFDDNDESLLFEGLHQYVCNKHYDSDFGDLVLIIICEELDRDLIIIRTLLTSSLMSTDLIIRLSFFTKSVNIIMALSPKQCRINDFSAVHSKTRVTMNIKNRRCWQWWWWWWWRWRWRPWKW